jgi:chloramphenicol-sensitive protein RarD
VIAGITAYLLWGFITVYWKALADFDPFELIGWRIVTSFVLLVGILGFTGRLGSLMRVISQRQVGPRVIIAALLVGANWTAYVYAVANDNVIETALGYFISPIGTMLIGVFVLGERLRGTQQFALALAVTAVVVLTISYGRLPIVALIIALTWSVYGLLKKQVDLGPLEGLTIESGVLLAPALIIVVVTWGRAGSVSVGASTSQWVLVAMSGVVTIVPLALFAAAARRLPLSVLGPMQYSVPTINFVLGWIVYGEDLPTSRLIGFALVWIGLAVVTIDSVNRSRSGPRRSLAGASRP